MAKSTSSEIVLNKDGSVYHLSLKPGQIGELIFTVGDPDRVHKVSQHFDSIDFKINKREFITHTGRIGEKKITVMSTGMGTANIEILMTELDLLENYDFEAGQFKSRKKALQIVRLGSSGSMQEDLPVGALLVSEYAVGLDNLMTFYDLHQSVADKDFSEKLRAHLGLDIQPYLSKASNKLMAIFGNKPFAKGITVTCPGFYAPQGRRLRVPIKEEKILEKMAQFHYNDCWLSNFEMETSAYYAFGNLMGHEVLSLNAILANRVSGKFTTNPSKIIDQMIDAALKCI
jgi:uridine phosphorylase